MRGLIDLLYPNACVGCGLPARGGLCHGCYEAVPRLGKQVCRRCGRPDIAQRPTCRDCRGRHLHFDEARQAAEFQLVLRKAVHQLKYTGRSTMARPLARLVVELVDGAADPPKFITWIPASRDRLRSTGVDHGRLIAQAAAAEMGVPSAPVLVRLRRSPPQMSLAPEERRTNLVGAFAATGPVPADVTVVDDVFTTGSTASEASRALKEAGATRVSVLCVARSFETL